MPNPCHNGGNCKSHLKEINELHLHEGALTSLIHGADESVVDVVEPDEEPLGDNSFTPNHHPELYEEHDQATNSDLNHGSHHNMQKLLPKLDSAHPNSEWSSMSHLFHKDRAYEHEHPDDQELVYESPEHKHRGHHYSDDTEAVQVHPRLDTDGDDHHVGYEEANSIHGADAEEHPHHGEHPFTEHHLHTDYDDDDEEEDNELIKINAHAHLKQQGHHDHLVLPDAAKFKSHSGGVAEEVESLSKDEERHNDDHLDNHDKHAHKVDQATVAEITKKVVDAVMSEKAKNSKRNRVSRVKPKRFIQKAKRTIHNLYVCECPSGFLGAHCQRKL